MFVWFGLDPIPGYGGEALFVAQAPTLAPGVGLVAVTRVGWRGLGLGRVAYAAIMLVGAGLNAVLDATYRSCERATTATPGWTTGF